MRVLVLVIASEGPLYTRFKQQWTRYMTMDPEIQCYFL